MKKKVIIGISAIIVGVFAIMNIVWLVGWKLKYDNFADGYTVEETGEGMSINYMLDEDGYTYDVNKPDYLSYKGSLSVSKSSTLSLIIWPGFASDTEYGLFALEDGYIYNLSLTEDGELLEDGEYIYSSAEKKIHEKYKDDIAIFLEKAHNEWDFE